MKFLESRAVFSGIGKNIMLGQGKFRNQVIITSEHAGKDQTKLKRSVLIIVIINVV